MTDFGRDWKTSLSVSISVVRRKIQEDESFEKLKKGSILKNVRYNYRTYDIF